MDFIKWTAQCLGYISNILYFVVTKYGFRQVTADDVWYRHSNLVLINIITNVYLRS